MKRTLLFCLSVLFLLSACDKADGNASLISDLKDKEWQLISIDGEAVDQTHKIIPNLLIKEDAPTIRASGNSGCNNFTGELELSEDKLIRVVRMAGTRKACIPKISTLESSVIVALNDWSEAKFVNQQLQLVGKWHTLVFVAK